MTESRPRKSAPNVQRITSRTGIAAWSAHPELVEPVHPERLHEVGGEWLVARQLGRVEQQDLLPRAREHRQSQIG